MWSKNAEQVVTNWRQFACGNNGLHGIRNLQQKHCVVKKKSSFPFTCRGHDLKWTQDKC